MIILDNTVCSNVTSRVLFRKTEEESETEKVMNGVDVREKRGCYVAHLENGRRSHKVKNTDSVRKLEKPWK